MKQGTRRVTAKTDGTLQYDKMVEGALRMVVRQALSFAAENGLPGQHHFYIGFDTGAPGVDIPDTLRADYPQEMTIALQYQFWDLAVTDDHFEVTLSFNKVPSRLVIPFAAVTSFVDPSVPFGLKFQTEGEGGTATFEDTEAANAPSADENAEGRASGDVITLDAFRRK